ncbi:MAG: shikimate dehydrogenase [Candidatus Melainabacteria bacterium]|nr:shikimate dehydrogenase [Candidatus Melainabacteria bacterium]
MSSRYLKLGLIGSSLAHSKSPEIHMAGLNYLGIEGEYVKFEIDPSNFESKVNILASQLDGLNVTIPYKETMLKYLNHQDELVTKIGATNTLAMKDSQIHGFNTDYWGFMKSLENFDLKDKSASILGAGGASRALIIALNDMGLSEINVYVRNVHKVEGTLPKIQEAKLNLELYSEDLELNHSAIIINATPVGQGRLSNLMPITIPQLELLREGTIVYDLIYQNTLMLQEAGKCKLHTINGSEMLILQAVKSLAIWTGAEITDGLVDAMRQGFHNKAAV